MNNNILLSGTSYEKLYELSHLLNNKHAIIAFNDSLSAKNNPAFIHETLKFCLDNEVDTVFNVAPTESTQLLDNKILFEEFNINIVTITNLKLEIYKTHEDIYSFEDFSVKSLKLGYPDKKILVISANEAYKNKIVIDDDHPFSIFNNEEILKIPFTHFTKIVHQKIFEHLKVIPVEDKIISFNFCVFNMQLFINYPVNTLQRNKIIDLVNHKNLHGFFNIVFDNDDLVLIQTV